MGQARELLAKYAEVVAIQGSDSAGAKSLRKENRGVPDFHKLAGLTDFMFQQLDSDVHRTTEGFQPSRNRSR